MSVNQGGVANPRPVARIKTGRQRFLGTSHRAHCGENGAGMPHATQTSRQLIRATVRRRIS